MKNANSSSAPLVIRFRKTSHVQPSHELRQASSPPYTSKKAPVVSHRPTFFTTIPPAARNKNAYQASCPHCPGDTHALDVRAIAAMIPKLDGLKKCLPRKRKINLLKMETLPAIAITGRELERNNKHKLMPVIQAIFNENL